MVKENYIAYLTYEKRFSPHTIIAYKADLSEFSDFLANEFTLSDPSQADYQMIRSWLIELFRQNISSRSIRRKLSTLKSFYRYCLRQGLIPSDPMLRINTPKFSDPLPVFLTNDNTENLVNLNGSGNTFAQERSKMILMLFYATGLRSSELAGLHVHDVSFENGTVKVLGKRNKERLVPFGEVLSKQLRHYIDLREEFVKEITADVSNNSAWLFVTDKGKQLYPKLIYNTVHTALLKVASNRKLSPHVLRHTFATHMLDNGADINAIKELLGHTTLAATQVYTHTTIEKLKSIYKQAHPRA